MGPERERAEQECDIGQAERAFGMAKFKMFVVEVEAQRNYSRPLAFAVGIGTLNRQGKILEVFYPVPNYKENFRTAAVLATITGHTGNTNAHYRISKEMMDQALELFRPFLDEPGHANVEWLRELQNSDLFHSPEMDPSASLPNSPKSIGDIFHHEQCVVVTFIHADEAGNTAPPANVPDAYLRLQLLSHRLIQPNGINLEGIFGVMPNIAWTSKGPIDANDLAYYQRLARLNNRTLTVHSADKFPRMADYVVPSGVRIADASRVRLGSHIGERSVVMHEGFSNLNAGCEGPNMIEGRIPAGVFVKANSDLGGGSSIMGTLSGGGKEKITIGENCLIGANAGTGIPLGDHCTVEAGLYVTAGTKIKIDRSFFEQLTGRECSDIKNEDDNSIPDCNQEIMIVKAKELSGLPGILFRRNSQTGTVEAIDHKNTVELNEALHKNA